MRKSFKIILDVDDVLLECNQYALITLNHAYGYDYGLDDIPDGENLGMTWTSVYAYSQTLISSAPFPR